MCAGPADVHFGLSFLRPPRSPLHHLCLVSGVDPVFPLRHAGDEGRFLTSISVLVFPGPPPPRRAGAGAAGAVPEEAAAVLHRLRLHGHSVGPEDEGVQALHAQRAGGLRDRQPGLPDRAGLSRGGQNGEWAGLDRGSSSSDTSESRESGICLQTRTLSHTHTHTPAVTRAVLLSCLMSTSRCLTTYSGPSRPATVTSLTQRRTNRRSRPPGHTYRCASWKRLQELSCGRRPLVGGGGSTAVLVPLAVLSCLSLGCVWVLEPAALVSHLPSSFCVPAAQDSFRNEMQISRRSFLVKPFFLSLVSFSALVYFFFQSSTLSLPHLPICPVLLFPSLDCTVCDL